MPCRGHGLGFRGFGFRVLGFGGVAVQLLVEKEGEAVIALPSENAYSNTSFL